MKRYFFRLITGIVFFLTACDENPLRNDNKLNRPKLLIAIVVDQMRPDYLERFYGDFSEGGFKRLMSGGYTMWNVHCNYVPTYTGPGHAAIYSGTTPRYNGIIGNDIYYRNFEKTEYCVSDPNSKYSVIGNKDPDTTKKYSPHRLIVTNLCDELKLCTNKKAQVISISFKDRAAILSAGHMADDVLWFDQNSGNFVTTSFYANRLPDWAGNFNARRLADSCLLNKWEPLYNSSDHYNDCTTEKFRTLINKKDSVNPGDVKYAGDLITSGFPHELVIPEGSPATKYSYLNATPFANTLLTDLAIEAVSKSGLGNDDVPDLLAISYSATDAVGHLYGPSSVEMKDTYLRLDQDLARLFTALDQFIGKDNYVLFLTADHGVAEIPQQMMQKKIPAGYVDAGAVKKFADSVLTANFSLPGMIEKFHDDQFYLNKKLIERKKLNLRSVQTVLADALIQCKGIAFAYTAAEMKESEFTSGIGMCVQNGFNAEYSGDVMIVLRQGYFETERNATNDSFIDYLTEHGTAYNYDTNIPLIWYGRNIKHGESWQLHYITDIAPTLSMILKVKYPSACIGNPIIEIKE